MTEEQNPVQEPKRTVPPAHARPSDEGGEDAASDKRTSPFPYANDFGDWVADETAAPDAGQRARESVDVDS